jgi:hypothetical protein
MYATDRSVFTFVIYVDVLSLSGPNLHRLLCGAGNFGRIWCARRQLEIQYTQRRMNKYTYNYLYNCNFLFYIHHVRKIYLQQEGKMY